MHCTTHTSTAYPRLWQQLIELVPTRPKVLISACLAGQLVRYDGQHKSLGQASSPEQSPAGQALLSLTAALELIQHCPEMDAGMGVPRQPIHWVQPAQGAPQLQWVNRPGSSVDYPLLAKAEQWCRQQPDLCAAIVKARSPSCGHNSTPLWDDQGQVLRLMDGVFIEQLKHHHPKLALVDESYFTAPIDSHWFIVGVYLYQLSNPRWEAAKRLKQQLGWTTDLTEFLTRPSPQRAASLEGVEHSNEGQEESRQ